MATWRTAKSLDVLLAEVNAAAPNRNKSYDGSIGDTAHAARVSDHNPNAAGVVRARDITDDPANGCDADTIAEQVALLLGKHPALKTGAYVIRSRRIISADRIREGWRPYDGSNPHDHHVHVSVTTMSGSSGYDSTATWGVLAKTPAPLSLVKQARILLTQALKKTSGIRAEKIRKARKKLPKS